MFIEQENPIQPLAPFRKLRAKRGVTLLEVMISCGVVILGFVGAMQTLLTLNSRAIQSRIQTNARAVVQRNIDRALSEKFTAKTTPAILATTVTGGAVWDDDGGGDNKVGVVVQDGSTTIVVPGVLTRTVTAMSNSAGAILRQITFSVAYTYRGKALIYSASTLRSRD